MTNNDIIRRIRYTFDYNDPKLVELFHSADYPVTRPQVASWLKKEEEEGYEAIEDEPLAAFLNGLINEKRGKREGPQPTPETQLTHNIILRKLKIALNAKDEDMLKIFQAANMWLSRHELSAFFRRPGHHKYRECKDQFLRNFLHGMQLTYRLKND